MDSFSASIIEKLLPEIKILGRAETLFLIQLLVSELAQQEGVSLNPNMHYPVWSPHQAYDAADVLLRLKQ